MPILSFTPKEKLASVILPAGYYSFVVTNIGEPKASGSKKSFNMRGQFTIIEDEKYEDKEMEIVFNTSENMRAPSVLGSLYMMPKAYIMHLAAAVLECPIDEVQEENFDTDSLKGLKFDGKVEKIINDGDVLNTHSAFLPYGTGKEKEAQGSPF